MTDKEQDMPENHKYNTDDYVTLDRGKQPLREEALKDYDSLKNCAIFPATLDEYMELHWKTIRAALSNSNIVPEGYALVPIEPTAEMINVCAELYCESDDTGSMHTAEKAYKAMIKAAQTEKE